MDSSSAPAVVNGTKRTHDSNVKDADANDPAKFQADFIKRLLSNIKTYTNNIAVEVENIRDAAIEGSQHHCSGDWKACYGPAECRADPSQASRSLSQHVICSDNVPWYRPDAEAPLPLRTIQPLLPATTSTAAATKNLMEKQVEAIAERVFDLRVGTMDDDITWDVCERVWEDMDENIDENIGNRWALMIDTFMEDLRDATVREVMDEEMVMVKEEVVANIKARVVSGDPNDSQDQLRALGDLLA